MKTLPNSLCFLFVMQLLFVLLTCRSADAQLGPATTVQLPVFGVSVNAEGVLKAEMFARPGGRLFIERARAARVEMDDDLFATSDLRMVSLSRLEAAIEKRLSAGEELTDAMLKLAGLQRIQYVFVFTDRSDILIAGPAGGWIEDAGGRAVGVSNNRPVLLLEDLLVAMRLFAPEKPHNTWVGCTIDPTEEGLIRLKEFNDSIPRSVRNVARNEVARKMREGIQESLGAASVKTFGIESTSNLAHILIEADYRMKLIAIGIEPPPVKMNTFASNLRSVPKNSLQRWWFSPEYKCLRVSEDRLSLEIVGDGVQLLTEDYKLDKDGRLAATGKPSRGSAANYANAFTKKYTDISNASPVYAQLRNMIDLLVVASYMNRHELYELAKWSPGLLLDADRLSAENRPAIKSAPCIANAFWNGNRLLAPAGGGVSILPADAWSAENLLRDQDGALSSKRKSLDLDSAADRWWWD